MISGMTTITIVGSRRIDSMCFKIDINACRLRNPPNVKVGRARIQRQRIQVSRIKAMLFAIRLN
jgi:hypothetical protein